MRIHATIDAQRNQQDVHVTLTHENGQISFGVPQVTGRASACTFTVDAGQLQEALAHLGRMGSDASPEADVSVTNQTVARNLRRARQMRGWTQQQAAERLEPHLGKRWSKVSFSAAERSVAGRRVKHFTAEEVAAFAAAFEVPIGFFFDADPAPGPVDLSQMRMRSSAARSAAEFRNPHTLSRRP